MSDYIMELRKLVGTRPLIMAEPVFYCVSNSNYYYNVELFKTYVTDLTNSNTSFINQVNKSLNQIICLFKEGTSLRSVFSHIVEYFPVKNYLMFLFRHISLERQPQTIPVVLTLPNYWSSLYSDQNYCNSVVQGDDLNGY